MARAGPNLGDGFSYGLTRYQLAERVGLTMYWLNTYWLTIYGLTHVRADHGPGGTAAAAAVQGGNDSVQPM